jgi:hypothetical protein
MSYDPLKDPHQSEIAVDLFGIQGAPITPSNTVDLDPYPKAVVVTAEGDLVIVPVGNPDNVSITFTGCAVGFIPPYRVRRVLTASTASVASVLG